MNSSLPDTTLRIERTVPVAPDHLWKGWTDPAVLVNWFTPVPWRTTEANIECRPGGIFRTVMEGPDGERNEGSGCILEVVEGRRLVWTSALMPGFAPAPLADGEFFFTAIIEIEPVEGGSRYRATVIHSSADDARRHAEMGFEAGWLAALDQLVALAG